MKNWSKTLAVSAVALSTIAFNSVAFAQTATTTAPVPVTTAANVNMVSFLRTLKVTGFTYAGDGVTVTGFTGLGSLNKIFMVNTTGATIIRKYGAPSAISEMSQGDMVRVFGQTASGTTNVTASHIRNYSVHKFRSVLNGTILSTPTSSGFTISAFGKTWTITVTGNTQYKDNTQNQVSSWSGLMVGDNIRTFGIEDSANLKETADAIRLLSRAGATTTPATTTSST
jgi:hypothetical protein